MRGVDYFIAYCAYLLQFDNYHAIQVSVLIRIVSISESLYLELFAIDTCIYKGFANGFGTLFTQLHITLMAAGFPVCKTYDGVNPARIRIDKLCYIFNAHLSLLHVGFSNFEERNRYLVVFAQFLLSRHKEQPK